MSTQRRHSGETSAATAASPPPTASSRCLSRRWLLRHFSPLPPKHTSRTRTRSSLVIQCESAQAPYPPPPPGHPPPPTPPPPPISPPTPWRPSNALCEARIAKVREGLFSTRPRLSLYHERSLLMRSPHTRPCAGTRQPRRPLRPSSCTRPRSFPRVPCCLRSTCFPPSRQSWPAGGIPRSALDCLTSPRG